MKNVGVVFVGMQPINKEQVRKIEFACRECDKVIVILVKEEEFSPFDIMLRRAMLELSLSKEYREKIEMHEIPLFEDMPDRDAGQYLYYNIMSKAGQRRFTFYSVFFGRKEDKWIELMDSQFCFDYKVCERDSTFDGLSNKKVENAFINNDKEFIKKYFPQIIVDTFDYLRKNYLGTADNSQNDFKMEE